MRATITKPRQYTVMCWTRGIRGVRSKDFIVYVFEEVDEIVLVFVVFFLCVFCRFVIMRGEIF